MATTKTRVSSFSRNVAAAPTPNIPGVKSGPNGTVFISSGIPDLDSNFLISTNALFLYSSVELHAYSLFSTLVDFSLYLWCVYLRLTSCIMVLSEILGGGFPLGSLVLVMEDPEAPHHMLLLRNFMSQGLIHNQTLLYSSPAKDPRGFLGTLPSPVSSKAEKTSLHSSQVNLI